MLYPNDTYLDSYLILIVLQMDGDAVDSLSGNELSNRITTYEICFTLVLNVLDIPESRSI